MVQYPYEEPHHAPNEQAPAAQALQHRDTVGQAEVTHEVGARLTPIPPVNALVHIFSYLAAYTLAQPKVKIGPVAMAHLA